jgi:hypothetical protein
MNNRWIEGIANVQLCDGIPETSEADFDIPLLSLTYNRLLVVWNNIVLTPHKQWYSVFNENDGRRHLKLQNCSNIIDGEVVIYYL